MRDFLTPRAAAPRAWLQVSRRTRPPKVPARRKARREKPNRREEFPPHAWGGRSIGPFSYQSARWELRQREAVPVWNRMQRWLDSDAAQRALPRSAIGKALGYLRNQWSALQIYLSDGRIPIDNDQSERTLRPLTVGRVNWLFLGHPRAAPGRLQMYSVVSSAHRHHLVIDDYLEDVLRRLADAQQNHPGDLVPGSPYLLDLLPDRWALTHPQSVRKDRMEERALVFDAKRGRRARSRVQARAAQAAAAR